jgi:large subunit ribosomal protein L19
MDLLKLAVRGQIKETPPQFNIGDTVEVHVKIVEGEKQRIQLFTGTVIGRKGSGINEMFTVRRIVNNEGVERIFPLHSPNVVEVNVKRSGVVRRSKLYFLRDRVGKATRLKEKWVGKSVRDTTKGK